MPTVSTWPDEVDDEEELDEEEQPASSPTGSSRAAAATASLVRVDPVAIVSPSLDSALADVAFEPNKSRRSDSNSGEHL